LSFSAVADPRAYFFGSTWFGEDFLATGILDADRFEALAQAIASLCGCYAIDEKRFRYAPASAASAAPAPNGKR
jgi:hypothetical protein